MSKGVKIDFSATPGYTYDIYTSLSRNGLYTLYKSGHTDNTIKITGSTITGDELYVKVTCPHCKPQIVKVRLVPEPISLTGSTVNGTCENCGGEGEPECNGAITLYVCGGLRPFTYTWTGTTKSGAIFTSTGIHTKDLSGLEEGTYTVVVNDSYGLTATTGFTLDVAPCNPPTNLQAVAPLVPTPTPTPTPTVTPTSVATNTPTPTPTATSIPTTFTGTIGWDTTLVSEACSKVNTANVTGNESTFCFSSTFTSLDFYSLGTGNYYLSDGSGYITASHTYGQNTMTKTSGGGCTPCSGGDPNPLVHSISMVTGTTLNRACSGKTSNTFYYTGSFVNGTVLYTDSGLTTVAPPGNSGGSRYYYAESWNTIYYIQDNGGHAYDTGQTCPPPTANPWTQYDVWYSDNNDVCSLPLITTLTIYGYGGTNIFNCSSLHDLPQYITSNQIDGSTFYLSDGNNYQQFLYKQSDHTATPTLNGGTCL
jgi:hypothetical protein